jgi:hypothetical protein
MDTVLKCFIGHYDTARLYRKHKNIHMSDIKRLLLIVLIDIRVNFEVGHEYNDIL